ncbi:cupin domain-containing protein [Candidatus Synechococcus calcipolaris G9]|uniref:Cupin domain-containing protein n=1 Tax=Candidatus Synechococcus calcipolaris G9 TaxID=1497997 RepID=A0ABT6F2B2_9SYNE|nr:cupin domain-containing protein [Candidatus Synechococcus calcipolaris]MDG2991918.1 cupin domain-containing protein [Candidatus Synechococcus calcipolaris G9]
MDNGDKWVRDLGLQAHPEGGYYREIYRSPESIPEAALPSRFRGGDRAYGTGIYFLLPSGQYSALHRIQSDELWHFYAGSSLVIHVIQPDGVYEQLKLGPRTDLGEQFQLCVPAGCWFGATVTESDSYTLVGCTVTPAFDFRDFELGDRPTLLALYPQHQALICALTPEVD